jgi:seryl-tRNA synthetase
MTDLYDPQLFYNGLVESGLIIPTGIKGGYGRSAIFEDVLGRFNDLVSRTARDDGAEEVMFPPIIPRTLIERVGYMDNFPQLAGSVHSFFGSDAQARELSQKANSGARWEQYLDITEVMLTPAACYPVYPMFSGLLPDGGRLVTVLNWIYRHEPSDEPTRLQAFRMREYIRVGAPEDVLGVSEE